MKTFRLYIGVIAKDLFQCALMTYLVLLTLETIKTGFVTFFFDMNILLWITLVSGVLMVLTYKEEAKITSVQIGQRVWHYFFSLAKGRVGKESKWQFLFKEVRAKEMLEHNFQYVYKDWMSYARETELMALNDHNLSIILREISLKRLVDRDWEYLSKRIDVSKKMTEREFYFIFLVSLGGAALVFYKTSSLGGWSLMLAILTFTIIGLLSFLIFTEQSS